MRCSGTGAPPVMNMRMAERSALPQRGDSGDPLEQVGVPESDGDVPSLQEAEDLVGIALLGDHDGSAFEQHRQHIDARPAGAEEGRDGDVTSSPRKSATDNRLTMFQVMLPCVSITPFGIPVVPKCA